MKTFAIIYAVTGAGEGVAYFETLKEAREYAKTIQDDDERFTDPEIVREHIAALPARALVVGLLQNGGYVLKRETVA